jgi:hypothetical protein
VKGLAKMPDGSYIASDGIMAVRPGDDRHPDAVAVIYMNARTAIVHDTTPDEVVAALEAHKTWSTP